MPPAESVGDHHQPAKYFYFVHPDDAQHALEALQEATPAAGSAACDESHLIAKPFTSGNRAIAAIGTRDPDIRLERRAAALKSHDIPKISFRQAIPDNELQAWLDRAPVPTLVERLYEYRQDLQAPYNSIIDAIKTISEARQWCLEEADRICIAPDNNLIIARFGASRDIADTLTRLLRDAGFNAGKDFVLENGERFIIKKEAILRDKTLATQLEAAIQRELEKKIEKGIG